MIDNTSELNLTEIVRQEVKEALKRLVAEAVAEETKKVLTIGDHKLRDVTPSDVATATRPPKEDKPTPDYLLPVKVVRHDGVVQHRRRKRTRDEMREAINKALPIVKQKHPDWSDRRLRRLAKNLVKRYKLAV